MFSEPDTIMRGRRASLSSEPGVRSLATSMGLMELTPLGMKVLSPQLSTCRPTRIVAGMPATVSLKYT
jgi:hypothetical protein